MRAIANEERANDASLVDRFLEVAVELFGRRGYTGVSVEEIVEAAGVTKGAFYYYLESKAELLYRIHDRFISVELAEGERILAGGGSASERLARLVRSLVRSIHDYLPYVTVFFHELHHLEEPYLSRIREKRDRYERMFVETVAAGVAAGEFRDDVEPRLVALALFGMCNWAYRWYRPDGPLGPEEIADRFLRLFMEGLARRDGR
ncbi:MAG: TetR/AcrR family transcriptional regulator [Firmicutes bacterium]|nr:TetR/AcrR family transcriptional regulator [Bacillota bacterium]